MYEKLIKEIKKYNQKSSFKIRYRKLKNKYTIYLELQKANQRKTINIENCFVLGLASTYNQDKNNILKAVNQQQVHNKQYELSKNDYFARNKLKSSNVLIFFEALRDSQINKTTRKSWNNTINHFRNFTKGRAFFKDIDLEFCEKFRSYMLTKISMNSTATYYSVFKAMLNHAMKHNIINQNPAKFVVNPKQGVVREFLSLEEIKQLTATVCYRPQIANAFLFSCLTGLRISDIRNLTWDNISSDTLEYTQKKTGIPQRIKVNESALSILNKQRKVVTGNSIFEVPASDANTNKHIGEWVRSSGINKHITFHCSRHTFATLCLTYDIDLFTVSKLLGHTDIKNTQIYAQLIDKKKDEAIDKLPTF
jgi:integrase